MFVPSWIYSPRIRTRGQGDKGTRGRKTTRHSPLATRHSPLATRHSPLATHHSPLTLLKTTVVLGITLVGAIAYSAPSQALQVRVSPAKPHLGDTLSVLITPDNAATASIPSVTLDRKSYPAFQVAPNQFRAFVPTTPLQKPGKRLLQVSSEDGERNLAVWVGNRKFPVQRIYLRPGKAGLEATEKELDRVAAFKQLVTPQKFWNGPFLKPNRGRISTIYGVRRYYNGKFANDYYHRGVDYAGAAGSPVVAPAAGRVALVGLESQGFRVHGNTIGIDHGQGVTSVFLHLSRIYVKEGDFVKAGQVIGAVGTTGASTGPHLHWGLYVQGESVDPTAWNRGLN